MGVRLQVPPGAALQVLEGIATLRRGGAGHGKGLHATDGLQAVDALARLERAQCCGMAFGEGGTRGVRPRHIPRGGGWAPGGLAGGEGLVGQPPQLPWHALKAGASTGGAVDNMCVGTQRRGARVDTDRANREGA